MMHPVEWEVGAKLGDMEAWLEVEKRKMVVALEEEAPSREVELKHEKVAQNSGERNLEGAFEAEEMKHLAKEME